MAAEVGIDQVIAEVERLQEQGHVVTMVGDGVNDAAGDAIRLARRTLHTIKANLFWAFAYHVAALPPAALGMLNPIIAGAAMASSSVFVVSNSPRLRRFQPLHR